MTRAPAPESSVATNPPPRDYSGVAPEKFSLVDLSPHHLEIVAHGVPRGARNLQDIYPLSSLQEGALAHFVLNEHDGVHALSALFVLESRTKVDELIDAIQKAIDRHDALRSAFAWEELPRPVQVVHCEAPLIIEEQVLERDPTVLLEQRMRSAEQFDVRRAPPVRLVIATDVQRARWSALLQVSPAMCDHASLQILLTETLLSLRDRTVNLPAVPPYRHYMAWALNRMRAEDGTSFFRAMLGDIEEPTAPFGVVDIHDPMNESSETLAPELARCIRECAERLGVSAATLFHCAFTLVIAHTSGHHDVVYGTASQPGVSHGIVGLTTNVLPLRSCLQDVTAADLLKQTDWDLRQLLHYDHVPLHEAQRCSGIRGNTPLFTAILDYRRLEAILQPAIAGVLLLGQSAMWTGYPVSLIVEECHDGYQLLARADARIDSARIVRYARTALRSLLDASERAPRTLALTLPILPRDERQRTIELFNATSRPYPRNTLVHELFEEQVQRTEQALAVTYEGQSLTYRELNSRANKLAHLLRNLGVRPGELIPVHMSRSLEMVIGHLAVLKNGCAYVPLDPMLPAERKSFMIRDSKARRILADSPQPAELAAVGAEWLQSDALVEAVADTPEDNLGRLSGPDAPAYVMYTSGSTGVPKGVVIPHHAVNRTVINNGCAQIDATDSFAHHSNPAFDASTLEVWCALLNGARVTIVPQPVLLDVDRFAELLLKQRVSVLYMSVGLFNQYAHKLRHVFARLRYLLVGGDVLDPRTTREVLLNGPPQCLLNVYGPTECTTIATAYRIESINEHAKSIPIGGPISNTRLYILDRLRQIAPIGVAGELYIGGPGVALGYLNRPELTAERFLPDPFSLDPKGRMYKTGDLARWRNDGTIDFLGRNDQQVKIRGFRIELGEIEARLVRHGQVKEAIVLAREDVPGDKRLVAYVTPRNGITPPADELRALLTAALPEYMVPSAFVSLDALPLTSAGKVNRCGLPAPGFDAYARARYEPPEDEVEQRLADIWQQLLHVERAGRHDHFFELGANSIASMRLIARIDEEFAVPFSVQTVMSHSTLHDMARHLATLLREKEALAAAGTSELEVGSL